ncbi:hypothetical protein [Streptacidiphilus jiangxiensis]|nr:hypothetical protein [Streptacidiphilus jiangxiensis]
MRIPGLGPVSCDDAYDGYRRMPLPIPALGNAACSVVVLGYDDDDAKEDLHTAVSAFLALDVSVLKSGSLPIRCSANTPAGTGNGAGYPRRRRTSAFNGRTL